MPLVAEMSRIYKHYKFEIVPIVVGALLELAGEFAKSQYNWKETKANTEKTAESIFNRDSKNMKDLYENVNKVDTVY